MNVVNTKKGSSDADHTFEETVKGSSLSLVSNPWTLGRRSHGMSVWWWDNTERAGTHGIPRNITVARSFVVCVEHPYYLPQWQVLLVWFLMLCLDFML